TRGQLLNDDQYYKLIEENGDEFDARMGAEAIYELLRSINIPLEVKQIREDIGKVNSDTKIKKYSKRDSYVCVLNHDYQVGWANSRIVCPRRPNNNDKL
ncbi:hypothetical protein TI05_15660, partial [Achromatium sp. WMS3]